ncbi:Protein F35G2.2 [Aphelenchoides avenae]|nr:Protein F35G2.2 [Aphelenchus avenae]
MANQQECLKKLHLKEDETILVVAGRLLNAAKILGLKTFVAEHQPEKFGHTADALQPLLKELDAVVLPKTEFSMYEVLKEHIPKGTKSAIVCGVAANICVYQSVINLMEHGLTIHLVANATTTHNQEDRLFAFEELRHAGAVITTADTAIMKLVGGNSHPKIQEVMKLMEEKVPETGLLRK